MSGHHTWDLEGAVACIESQANLAGAMLPVLHALMEEFGYIDAEAVPLIADRLNLSRAEVVGVINFYHDFRQEPPGRHTIQLCRAEACQAMGAEALAEHVQARLGVQFGETTSDGAISLKAVYCLGNCALSPAVMVDGQLFGRVSAGRADTIIAEALS